MQKFDQQITVEDMYIYEKRDLYLQNSHKNLHIL